MTSADRARKTKNLSFSLRQRWDGSWSRGHADTTSVHRPWVFVFMTCGTQERVEEV